MIRARTYEALLNVVTIHFTVSCLFMFVMSLYFLSNRLPLRQVCFVARQIRLSAASSSVLRFSTVASAHRSSLLDHRSKQINLSHSIPLNLSSHSNRRNMSSSASPTKSQSSLGLPSMTPALTNRLLDYFFGSPRFEQLQMWWFKSDASVDAAIKEKFNSEMELIKAQLPTLPTMSSAEDRLALILLLDQFPRNLYRGSERAFATDKYATQVCIDGIKSGDDMKLSPTERGVYLLPLMHSEDLAVQELSIQKFTELGRQEKFARDHYDTIKRFGRFPYRNKALNRANTSQEQAFLDDPKTFIP